MHIGELLNSLYLLLLYKEIDPVPLADFLTIIDKGKQDLSLDLQASLVEFAGEACLISAFKQARSQRPMDL